MSYSLFFQLNHVSHAAAVSSLHLGAVEAVLTEAGLNTLGALLSRIEIEPRGIRGIPGLDRKAVLHIQRRLEALSSVIDDKGNVDWEAFDPGCDRMSARPAADSPQECRISASAIGSPPGGGAECVPSGEVEDGNRFIGAFPEVIEAIIRTREHEADRLILTERLARQPHERKTLEQLAAAVPGSITRERIRQRERKMLAQLAGALLNERHEQLGLVFRDSFTDYWRRAAEWFGQEEEVTFTSFIEGLQKAWNVPVDQLFVHLPLIMSVLTSKATIPAQMRNQMKLDPRVYSTLHEEVRQTPLTMLASGKSTGEIRQYGVATIGDLFDLVRAGKGPDPETRVGRSIRRLVAALTDAIAENGRIDWRRYAHAMDLVRLPEQDPDSVVDFLRRLPDDMEAIIRTNAISSRALEIFRRRIAVSRSSRPTLAEVAVLLNTYGSSIKREESLLLTTLNDHLIERDLTRSRVLYAPRFLGFWSDAACMHQDCGGNFNVFCVLAGERWGVARQQVAGNAEILWAVLNEYPGGRPVMKRIRPEHLRCASTGRLSEGGIVLRGFRKVH